MSISDKNILPSNIRILLGVFSIPSLFLAYMIGVMVMDGDYQKVDYFEWFYALIGMLAIYIAITGKRLF